MKFIRILKKDITPDHKNKPVLLINKGYREYGVLSHADNLGIHIYFAMNKGPLIINTGQLYLTEIA